jgi:putative membrane-bound dehydrogenase-like protein
MLVKMKCCLLVALVLPIVATWGASGLSPEQALQSFQLGDPALRVELVASEPLTESPCALAFDEAGRLFVAENRGYPNTAEPPQGRIARLTDTDGDGRMDKRSVFAEGFTYPNGVLPWRGGIIVTCAPDVLFLKDTDGDGRADERRVLLTGFATSGSTQLRINAPTLGPDGWIYLAAGLSGGSITCPAHPERPAVKMTADVRFHPDTLEVENVDGRSQYGQSFDDYGRRFLCMNRLPVQHVVLASRWLRRNPHLAFSDTVQDCHERDVKTALKGGGDGVRLFPISSNVTTADSHAGSFSAACAVYRWPGGALPDAYRDAIFSCDPTGNLVHVDRLEPRGPTFLAKPLFANKEFLASKDDWFRPVYLTTGPDGALYIADMYRLVIEHPDYLPEEVRKRTDFESGKSMGRIWKVTRSNARAAIVGAATDERIKALSSENGWTRQTAFRLLREQPAPVATLQAALPGNAPAAQAAILNLLAQQSAVDADALQICANSSEAELREVALRIWMETKSTGGWLPDPAVLGNETNPRTRFMFALALGEIPEGTAALASIAAKGAADRWTRAAVLSGIRGREAEFLGDFLEAAPTMEEGETEILRGAGRSFPSLASLRQGLERLKVGVDARRSGSGIALVSLLLGFSERSGERLEAKSDDAWLASILNRCAEVARDSGRGDTERRLCIGLLGRMTWEKAGAALLEVAAREKNEMLRDSAIRAAAGFPQAEVARTLLASGAWARATPIQREIILEALLAGGIHASGVLDAIEEKRLPANAIPALRRTALLKNKDAALRERAEKLLGKTEGDRQKAFEASKAVLALKANPAHGRELFQQLCATCHRLDRMGYAVGPDLLDIRNQPKENILFHIVVPDAEIAPAFAAYIAEARDGRTLSGILASETSTSITLRGPLAQETNLLRAELKSLEAAPSSLMPAGLEQAMKPQDLADLVGYLKGE